MTNDTTAPDLIERLRYPINGMRPTLTDGRAAANALEAAQARIAELEGSVNKDLSDKMVAAGMIPLDEMTKPNCLTKFAVHSGMTDLSFFMEWLERKAKEYRRMQAAHQTGVHPLDEDMFDFILGKASAFTEVLENYRAALEGKG